VPVAREAGQRGDTSLGGRRARVLRWGPATPRIVRVSLLVGPVFCCDRPWEVHLSRSGRIAILLAGLVVGAGLTLVLSSHSDEPTEIVGLLLGLVIGWSFIGAGVVAWTRRPGNRTGPLMVLVGFLWFIGRLDFASQPQLQEIGDWVRPLHIAVFAHLLLAFPTGRLESSIARVLAVAAYVNVGVLDNAPLILGDTKLASRLVEVSQVVTALIFVAIIAVLARRWHAGTAAWRRSVGRLFWPGAVSLATLVLFLVNEVFDQPLGETPGWLFRIAYAGFPLLFLAGLLQTRLARGSVADLVVELEKPRAASELRDAIARTLADPTVAVAYWLPDEQRYVDIAGRPVALPRGDDRRAATLVEREGHRVAAILHDEALCDDPELLRAVSAAAALALDNARLQAELRARLDELKASRQRIVEAADSERRRIERNLHDATQQRLTSVTLALGLAESQLSSDPEGAQRSLAQAKETLASALADLRDLSQGIHPSVLTAGGLEPALADLAYTAPLPVRISADLNGRLPEQVEAGAYYLIAEALANVAKHAQASRAAVTVARERGGLSVSIRDDGVGGADARRGSGLRGLVDRVQALEGTFELESAPGRGTEIRAWIPCA
jgi:signal transduction histidine kinase